MRGGIQHWKWHPLTPTEFQITNFRIVEQTFDKGAEWPEHKAVLTVRKGHPYVCVQLISRDRVEN